MARMKLSLDKPLIIERFSNELRRMVSEISASLRDFFEDSINGVFGNDHKIIVTKLFSEWCYRNDIIPLNDLYDILRERIKHIIELSGEDDRKREIDRLVKDIVNGTRNSEGNIRSSIARCIANVMSGRTNFEEIIWSCTKDLLDNYISLFLDQTAHVIIARLLVYRVMEDKGYVPKLFIDNRSGHRYDSLKMLIEIRQNYETLLPNIYALSEFDWWYIPDIKRGILNHDQKMILRRYEESFKYVLDRVINVLINYDLSDIDFDIWQRIYQHYLPDNERQRLGGFYTPHELASLIIDLSGYRSEAIDLCKKKVLDPACGSGTFIVEVTRRLIKHLESRQECHKLSNIEWVRAKSILETIKNNIYAIDIHPFATFLTSLNLTMLLLDYYFRVHHQDPEYRLELNVVTADSLMKYAHISITGFLTNARLEEAHRRLEKYKKILSIKFDYVFGNPPWGSVLKGSLSPLWNPRKREEYRRRYKSACGKYDVYVLFIERGIEWLRDNGVLGMVVNNRFLTRGFGECIRRVIVDNTRIKYIIDFSEYGSDLFPDATNYPVVIILEKHVGSKG